MSNISERPLGSDAEKAIDIKEKAGSDHVVKDWTEVVEHAKTEGVDAAYEQKVHMINACFENEIGWGRYQLELFLLSGFGWLADNIWLQGVAIILPEVAYEFKPKYIAQMTLSLYAGLIVGATTWGFLADIIGRRLSWNITLFLAGVFGIAAGAAPNFVALGVLLALLGFGVGGNLPVDGALFLEFIPRQQQWTLTLLSAFWSLGQLYASLIAWAFIANFTCAGGADGPCPKSENMGWRYTFYTLGASTFVMFLCRFVMFNLQESPKFLIAKGRDEEAIKVLEYVARKNGRSITLTLEMLRAAGDPTGNGVTTKITAKDRLKKMVTGFSFSHIKPLFSTRRLAINSGLVILIWGLIGLAYPLYNAFLPIYLSEAGASIGDSSVSHTYRNYAIISIMGIPGSLIACIMVDWQAGKNHKGPRSTFHKIMYQFGGRKFAMASSTALTGVFLFLFTTARTNAAVLGWNCASGLTQNAFYGVLYAYTPEVFPGPHRGTGDALASAFNRITGLMAPIIKNYATNASGNVPIYVSASLFLVTSVLMMALPIETAGVAAL